MFHYFQSVSRFRRWGLEHSRLTACSSCWNVDPQSMWLLRDICTRFSFLPVSPCDLLYKQQNSPSFHLITDVNLVVKVVTSRANQGKMCRFGILRSKGCLQESLKIAHTPILEVLKTAVQNTGRIHLSMVEHCSSVVDDECRC